MPITGRTAQPNRDDHRSPAAWPCLLEHVALPVAAGQPVPGPGRGVPGLLEHVALPVAAGQPLPRLFARRQGLVDRVARGLAHTVRDVLAQLPDHVAQIVRLLRLVALHALPVGMTVRGLVRVVHRQPVRAERARAPREPARRRADRQRDHQRAQQTLPRERALHHVVRDQARQQGQHADDHHRDRRVQAHRYHAPRQVTEPRHIPRGIGEQVDQRIIGQHHPGHHSLPHHKPPRPDNTGPHIHHAPARPTADNGPERKERPHARGRGHGAVKESGPPAHGKKREENHAPAGPGTP